jgi:hypothetical protein
MNMMKVAECRQEAGKDIIKTLDSVQIWKINPPKLDDLHSIS